MAKFHLIPIVLGAAIGVGVYVVSKYLAQDEESEHIVDDSAFDDSEASESTEDADETEQTEFPTMLEETQKIEACLKNHCGGHIRAAYGCSLGGSFVGLLAARQLRCQNAQ